MANNQKFNLGHLHPITKLQRQIEEIFSSMGFSIIEGPEIVSEFDNFDALNIPEAHPTRDDMDTFYLENNKLLRAHTSAIQNNYLKKNKPPLRVIVPGRCYRNERTDATHDFQFHQVEALFVDKQVSVANFKAILGEFFSRVFNKKIQMRLRPGFFPFVEPGFEVDIKLNNKWLEIMGAGMVHPNVFKNAGINPKEWQGFAFGLGVERLAMIKYKIDDIRLFHNPDLRFIKQFK